ncbi:MAG: metallophosphoesterase family protein [Myxococcota bacterium]|nr:metallophosphoesterase family protein [Myxococcota bacterium]
MPLRGRGARYSRGRHVVEWTLANAYRGHWPAKLVKALGLQPPVRPVRHHIATRKWPAECRPLRIAFASDLHAGPTTHPSTLDDAFSVLAAVGADVILLGGDYVFLFADYVDQIAARVSRLAAPLGIYAVMGNHDLWADDAMIARALEGAGARVLVNERVVLPAPFDHVVLAGVDDPWTGAAPSLPLFEDDGRVRIVLVHAPEAMTLLDGEPFDLALCGHTHGGHIALPGGIPIVAPGPLSRTYAHGRYTLHGDRTLIVSRGVGSTEVSLRLNADPDILVVELAGM